MSIRTKFEKRSLMHCTTHIVAGAMTLLLLLPLAARGGGVVTECTEPNLRSAMAGGGTVTFACDGTIELASTITNVANTTLDASGHQITLSGNNAVRVFYVTTNSTLALINLTVANGRAITGAGIFNDGGNLILQGADFCTNSANSGANVAFFPFICSGGAIFNRGGSINASKCAFIGNGCGFLLAIHPWLINPARGGAIVNSGGEMILDECDFIDNHATGSPPTSPLTGPASAGGSAFAGAIYNTGGLN